MLHVQFFSMTYRRIGYWEKETRKEFNLNSEMYKNGIFLPQRIDALKKRFILIDKRKCRGLSKISNNDDVTMFLLNY